MKNKISINGLVKEFTAGYSRLRVLDGIDLDVSENEFCCLIGPSGCGKTTTLRAVSGLEVPTEGSITVNRSDRAKNLFAYVFQHTMLFPWLTLKENLALGISGHVRGRSDISRQVKMYLSMVDLDEFGDFYPGQLSGGMRKRASVARALSVDPEIILMDEPFVSLDAQAKTDMHNLTLELYSKSPRTIIFVTHDIREAIILSSRIIVMSALPSRIKAVIDVPFKYPRNVDDVLPTDEFHDIYWQVDNILKDEVKKTSRMETGYLLEKNRRGLFGGPYSREDQK